MALPLLACGGKASDHVAPAQSGGGAGANATAGTGSSFGGADLNEPDSGGQTTGGVGGTAGQLEPSAGAGSASGGVGGAGDPDGDCVGEVCRLAIDPAPRWVTRLRSSGRGAAQISFFDDGKTIRVGTGETNYLVSALDLATGEMLRDPTPVKGVVASDTTGSRIVSALDRCTVFIDGVETFAFDCVGRRAIRFSADGSVVANHQCVSQETVGVQVEAYDSANGELLARTIADLPCFYGDLNVLVDAQRRRTLFAHPQRPDLFVFDWKSQTIETRAIHQSAPVTNQKPYNREGTILNLALSPDGQRLVSVGAADGLAVLDPDSLAVELRLPEVPFFNVYDQCFTTFLSESPVAWSRAGEIFATGRQGGGITLRDVATRTVLGFLDPPTDPTLMKTSCSSDYGPVLMEFSPDMRTLVVLYPGAVSAYSLAGRP